MGMYDDLAALYDLFVDWPSRLKNELPLLERLGVGLPGQRIVDAACGTGQHARAWADRGAHVVAIDASAEMIGRARRDDLAGRVDWRVGDFAGVPADGTADALVCIGTSLPHVPSRDGYRAALAAFARSVRPGGRVIVQGRNLPRTLATGERFLPPLARTTAEGTVLFWRFYDLLPPEHVDFHLAVFRERPPGWTHHVLTSRLCVIAAEDLAAAAAAAGLTSVRTCGHLDGRPYELASPDLVLVAERPR